MVCPLDTVDVGRGGEGGYIGEGEYKEMIGEGGKRGDRKEERMGKGG